MLKRILVYVILMILGTTLIYAQSEGITYLVPVKGEINSALVTYVNKAIKEAEKNDAALIIFEIDTYGGIVNSAIEISDAIIDTSLPTVCYIEDNAISAGVIIAISGDRVVANKAINIGSAETRPKEEKYISYWAGRLKRVAKLKGRDPEIIAGMADADIEIEGITEKGKLINLTADEALKYGVIDKVVSGRRELYEYLGVDRNDVIELKYDWRTSLAQITNNSIVSTMLLAIGIIGIVGEIFTAGFGALGSIGILSLALYFAGKFIAGHTGWSMIILFVAGIILLGIEAAIPGFGVPGIAGIVCVVTSILLGSSDPVSGAISFVVAIIASIIILALLLKRMPKSKLFDRIILKNDPDITKVDVSMMEKKKLIGMEGEALTFLRPAGIVIIGDEKLDVVSEGEYVEKGARVRVVAVEGNRIVVRKI
ncbi:MAG: nodulation protein NfeD [Clostridiaceae bacterium]|nr:nodulation protein NfeD [Clostridiaceae bacterium]